MNTNALTKTIRFDGQVLELTIGPAPANIVTMEVIEALTAELHEANCGCKKPSPRQSSLKLIVLKGSDKHFSFGASVEEHRPEVVGDMLPKFNALVGRILDSKVPVLAKVSGMCLGGGFEMVMACHFVFCGFSASFAVPEIGLGLFPPPASVLLPMMIADKKAQSMILTGEKIGAEEALKIGLVNQISPDENLSETVDRFIEKQILAKSGQSLRLAAKASRMVIAERYRALIGNLERLYLDELMATEDAKEGIRSFMEKRKPVWTNS